MQKLSIPCIKTGEFARLCNTNKRTLFYYDEIGLFSPAYTDEKGYRYYSESQCDVFFTIACLQEIGMPLKDIKKYIDHRNPRDLKTLLTEQSKRVRTELDRLKRIEQVIQTKINLVNMSEELGNNCRNGQVVLEEMPEEYLVVSPRIDSDDHDLVMGTLCDHIGYCNYHELNAGHPYGAMIRTEMLFKNHWDTYAYFFIKVLNYPDGHPCHVKPAGLYAVTYLKGDYYDAGAAYERLLDFVQQEGLVMGDFSYKEAVLDEISVDCEEEYLTRISVEVGR